MDNLTPTKIALLAVLALAWVYAAVWLATRAFLVSRDRVITEWEDEQQHGGKIDDE